MLLRGNPWTLRLTGGYLLYILQTIARIHSSPIHCCHCCNVLVPRNQNGVACNFCTGAEGNTIEAVLGVASFCGSSTCQLLYLCSWCPGCSLCRGPWTRTATEKREVHIGCGDPVPSVWRWDQPVMELSKQSSKYPSDFKHLVSQGFPFGHSRLKSGGHSWMLLSEDQRAILPGGHYRGRWIF